MIIFNNDREAGLSKREGFVYQNKGECTKQDLTPLETQKHSTKGDVSFNVFFINLSLFTLHFSQFFRCCALSLFCS